MMNCRFLSLPGCVVLSLLAATLTGCAHCGWPFLADPCADVAPGAIPAPPGSHIARWQEEQTNKAEEDDFVIYRREWKGETTQLGPSCDRRLGSIAQRLATQPNTVVVEPCENTDLNVQRQTAMIEQLAARGVQDAGSRVRIGYGSAEGLYGEEAPRLERAYIRGSGGGGTGGAQGGGLGGGIGGGGGGGLGGGGGGGFGGGIF